MNPMRIFCYVVAAAMAIATAAIGFSQRMFPADSFIIISGIVALLIVMGYLLRSRR